MATSAEVMYSRRIWREPQAQELSTSAQVEWARRMRKTFSPPDMLQPNGDIDQEFFKPTQIIVIDDKKWGTPERELLYQGLERYGIGKWREIGTELLPRWDDNTLRIKACRLMGSQSLARYVGWKGNREAVEEEYSKNKELGEALGCWKAGVLVENNEGSVAKALKEQLN